jgi:hypothetical protein
VLILKLPLPPNHTVVVRARVAKFEHLDSQPQFVPWTNRMRPTQILETRRARGIRIAKNRLDS